MLNEISHLQKDKCHMMSLTCGIFKKLDVTAVLGRIVIIRVWGEKTVIGRVRRS
jgi:hypothetical protein